MEIRYATSPTELERMNTAEIRERFLIESLFRSDEVVLVYSHHDRLILGSAVPHSQPLLLHEEPELRTEFFLERRELGVVNIGAEGVVRVDGETFSLGPRDCLYVGMGHRDVQFEQGDGRYYLVSAPAHRSFPTQMVRLGESFHQHMGSLDHSNERTLHRFIHQEGLQSCQLMLGMTLLDHGNVWNTMPAHLHDRRMEAYLYFGMDEEQRVFHMMGRPDETRHLVVANEQAVISPSWSVHAGAGTSNYGFIWAMAGENYSFTDMDPVSMADLR